jgi:UDP-glucose 4-epimerase
MYMSKHILKTRWVIMKNILVTGGAGYIGSHTTVELLESGYNVICVDNFSNSSEKVFDVINDLTGKQCTWYNVDVCNIEELNKIVAAHDVNCAVHFAGYKAVGESVEFPLMYYQNNINSTLSLCEVCLKNNVRSIIFSSSATVYGPPQYLPLDEKHSLSATNPYGNCKLFIEQILKDVNVAHPALNIALLRYFNPVGAHGSYRLGERPKGIPNNLMPYICQTALGVRQELRIFGNDYDTIDGTGVRDFIHVVDLAKGHVAAIKKMEADPGCFVYNLGTGNGTSVLELVNTFMEVNGVDVPYVIASRRVGDIAACWANPEAAKEHLGWEAQYTIEDMVRDSWEAQKALGVCT